MAAAKVFNFDEYHTGTTFLPVSFMFENETTDPPTPIDLTGANIKVQFRKGKKNGELVKEVSMGNGISGLDLPNGEIQIDSFDIDWKPAMYYYDLFVVELNGRKSIYVQGTVNILDSVTNG